MNEDTQLKAMAAELAAAGYDVGIDVPGEQLADVTFGRLEGMRLDIVASLVRPGDRDEEHPGLLVIEVANRRRPPGDRSRAGRPPPRYVEDEEALERFEVISSALADLPHAELQIRFFDVSADQAAARQVKGPLRNKEAMLKRIAEDRSTLVRSAGRDDLSRALVVARLWSSWLRIVGKLNPGSRRSELKDADLRTIQKDLFDQQVIDLRPASYAAIHRSLLAAFEGGDVDVRDLIGLQPQVWKLLDWAGDRYGAPQAEIDSSRDDLIGRLWKQFVEGAVGQRREDLVVAWGSLWLAQGSSAFPSVVADFLLALGHEPVVSDDLITELLEQAARSPA